MADEDVKGTSADAEEPTEDEQLQTPAAEAAETPADEPVAEAAEEVADEALAKEPTAEAEEAAAAEAPEGELVADAEPAVDEPVAEAGDEPAAAEAAPAEEPAAAEAAPTTGPKPKRKRLPRALRPKKTRPARIRSTERKPIVRLEEPAHERGRRQERQGKVVSDAMEKTIVVEVSVVKAHPRYKKVVRRSVKFHAHDERSEAKVGDLVRIVETRPLSRTKRWRLVEVVEAAK
jgi:small subunit ribosomal protein S17